MEFVLAVGGLTDYIVFAGKYPFDQAISRLIFPFEAHLVACGNGIGKGTVIQTQFANHPGIQYFPVFQAHLVPTPCRLNDYSLHSLVLNR